MPPVSLFVSPFRCCTLRRARKASIHSFLSRSMSHTNVASFGFAFRRLREPPHANESATDLLLRRVCDSVADKLKDSTFDAALERKWLPKEQNAKQKKRSDRLFRTIWWGEYRVFWCINRILPAPRRAKTWNWSLHKRSIAGCTRRSITKCLFIE